MRQVGQITAGGQTKPDSVLHTTHQEGHDLTLSWLGSCLRFDRLDILASGPEFLGPAVEAKVPSSALEGRREGLSFHCTQPLTATEGDRLLHPCTAIVNLTAGSFYSWPAGALLEWSLGLIGKKMTKVAMSLSRLPS